MGAINIKDLVKLIFLCIGLMFATVVMAYLLASVIVYFKINTLISIGVRLFLMPSEWVELVEQSLV